MAMVVERAKKGNQRVLIVEDDPESKELLKTLFLRKGFDVVGTAANGKEALEKYRELRPDIVTMDIMIPYVNGKACTKNILEFDPHANIVVVSVLGHDELESLKALGVKAFIKKPFDIDELFDAIINVSVSIIKDERGEEMGAVGMARAIEDETASTGLFIDVLRHDILNPLGLIKNFAELMEEDTPANLKTHVEAILRNTDRLIELIDDATKLSKIDKLRRLPLEELNLSEVIKNTVAEMTPLAEEKKVKIENKIKGRLPVMGNVLLGDVFSNLLSNAVKYGPIGGVVTVEAVEENNCFIISFKDSGPGVKDAYKKTIFERFERTGKEGVKGTGIGLAIVKRVIALHKGEAWVEDNKEVGSIFKVRIPKRGGG